MIDVYYTYNKETLEVNQVSVSTTRHSKLPEYPRDALLVKPLEPKEGFIVRVCEFVNGRPTATEYSTDFRGKTIYNTAQPSESKQVKELGEIEQGWTLKESPPHSIWQGNDWVQQIDLLRVAKRNDINQWRADQEANPDEMVTVDSIEWDANPSARSRIESTLNSDYLPPFWTDANDVDQPITLDTLKSIHTAIVQRGFEIHARQRTMKAEIEQITDFATLDAYPIGWPE